MSAMIQALSVPRATQRVWYSMSSIETGNVDGWPWITIPSESPTNRTSTPASSSARANEAS